MSCEQTSPLVGITMGSDSDMPAMAPCMTRLAAFGLPYAVKVSSATLQPTDLTDWPS